jgi:hypothetical protein
MPPVAGLVTVTGTVWAVAIAACGIMAVTWPALSGVVVICVPLKVTNAPEPKLLPSTFNGKAGPPAVALGGLKLAIVGTVPGVAMGWDPYPHPMAKAQSIKTVSSFIDFSVSVKSIECRKITRGECLKTVTFL